MIWIILFFFCILFFLPFFPGTIELVKKTDANPLFIPMDYIRNPRYFGKSFKQLLFRSLTAIGQKPGCYDIQLSKPEQLEVCESKKVPKFEVVNHILYVYGNLLSEDHVKFNKEIFATKDALIGSDNIIQALASEGGVKVSNRTRLRRWLDANGTVEFGSYCDLGISVSSGTIIRISDNCFFRRLYGMPVTTSPHLVRDFDFLCDVPPDLKGIAYKSNFARTNRHYLPPGRKISSNLVFEADIKIGENSVVHGSIKSYGNITLAENIIIVGNVFADRNIFVGKNCQIIGHLFSQMNIYLSGGVRVSCSQTIKSVIGKKSITIEPDVVVYGFLGTEGKGQTVGPSNGDMSEINFADVNKR